MIWTDDPEADFERYDSEQQKELDKLPICDECGEHIQDEYLYDIEGEILCRVCMEIRYERSVENYME